MNIGGVLNLVKLAGSATSVVGLSPQMIGIVAAGFIFAVSASFGAGMIVEARWSQNLLITRAEEAKDKAIAALNKKVAEQALAAQLDAQARSDRETELQSQVNTLLFDAEKLANNTIVLPKNLVDAIDRAGAGITRK